MSDLFEKAFGVAPLPMSLIDSVGTILQTNDAYLEMLRARDRGVNGRMLVDFVLADDVPLVQDAVDSARKYGSFSSKAVLKRADGTVFLGRTRIQTLRSGPAENWRGLNSVEVFAEDDATVQTDEFALRQVLLEHTDAVFARISEDGRYAYVSPACAYVCGYQPEELLGRSVDDFLHADDRGDFRRKLSRAFAARQNFFQAECRRLHKSGRYFWAEFTGRCVPAETGKLELVCAARDITRRRKVQEELQGLRERLAQFQSDEWASARQYDRQRVSETYLAGTGRIVAQIAHEINNPLAGTMSAVELIGSTIATDHPYRKFVDRAHRELDRIAEIVQLMFSLYRSERPAGARILPARVVRDVVALVERRIKRNGKQIRFETNVSPHNLEVVVPETFLRQILFNLALNACDATEGDAPVCIEITRTGGELIVQIRDQGVGIPESIRPDIFRPFFTTKSAYSQESMGLGLTITRDLVQTLDGTIHLESVVGAGTTFTVRLPIQNDGQNTDTVAPDSPGG